MEGEFPDEKLSRLLKLSDLTESNRAWSEPVRLLDATNILVTDSSGLTCGLVGKLLTRSLGTSGLASSLLSSCHDF